jgi:3-deoxy-D-manno-octulosonic acid kinase
MTSVGPTTAPPGGESRLLTRDGAMLCDPSLAANADEGWFDPDHWPDAGNALGGRGGIVFLRSAERRWVLRHYRRGGAVAALLGDRYLWTGEDRTRSFREWRLLRRLADWALPVPRAIAARYARAGAIYRADLITEELVDTRTLTVELRSSALDDARWREIGACVRRFHECGVRHADLNAHNVLLGANRVYLLDFDRGEVRPRGPWEQAVLARLHRSLVKVTGGLPPDRFGTRQWATLLDGYRGGSGGS